MSDKQAEPPRPYYQPKVKRAVVVPVVDWTIAKVLFWSKDKKKIGG
jgi:hypothetical protein